PTKINTHSLHDALPIYPKKKAKSYSKGNRQKVGLIAALSVDSDLYILDEPTSGLDPLMESIFQEEIEKVKETEKAVLLSSHIVSEVERLADKVAIIRRGKIVESGSLEELRHLTRSTGTLITEQDVTQMANRQGIHVHSSSVEELQHLTRSTVTMITEQDVTQMSNVEGVYDFEQNNNQATFSADPQHLNIILNEASKLDVKKFESVPPTLEDLFMRHYER